MDGGTAVTFFGPIDRNVGGTVIGATNVAGTLNFTNSSTVKATDNLNNAIDWSLGTGGNATLTNNVGASIRGQILLPISAGVVTTFNIFGGEINGNIIQGGGAATSNLNFQGTYSTPGNGSLIQGISNINVNNNGTIFTTNTGDDVTGFNNFTISPQTSAISRSTWNGNNVITVGGQLTLDTGSSITIPSLNLNTNTSVVNVVAKGVVINAPMTGVAGSSFNVNADFPTADSITGVDNITVATNKTFTVSNPITGYTNFTNNGNVKITSGLATLGGGMTGGVNSTLDFKVLGVPTYDTAGDFTNIDQISVTDGVLKVNNNFTGFSNFTIGDPTGTKGRAIMAAGSSLSGTQVTLGTKLEVQSGTISSNIVGVQPAATLQFDNNFTTNGNITNVPTITVNSGFNINNSITGVTNFINTGTTTVNAGAVLGDAASNLVINSAGGTFNVSGGQVIAKNINNANVFTLNSGSVTGNVVSANTVNLNGGTLSGNITGNPNVNVGGTFTTGGTIAANNLTVTNIGAFTVDNPITATNFIVNAGGSTTLNKALTSNVNNSGNFTLNADVTGIFNNSGTVAVSTNHNITNSFVQGATGTYQVTIEDVNLGDFGQIHTTGASNLSGTVKIVLPDNGVRISNGDEFDILIADAGIGINNAVIAPTSSALLSFVRDTTAPNTVFRIMAERISFESVSSDETSGVAAALDAIRADSPTPGQIAVLQALDGFTTTSAVQQGLLQLAPDTNAATVLSTLYAGGLDLPLERIAKKLQSMRAGVDLFKTGYAAGDLANGHGSYGPMIFGNNITLKSQNGVPGFNALTFGAGLLGDIPVFRYAKIGAAASFASTTVKDTGTSSPSKTTIASAQGSLYASADYCLFFADGMLGFASNRYKTDRTITLIGSTATSKYSGTQINGRADVGLSLPMGRAELAPLTTFRYSSVRQGAHTETGATGATGATLNIASRTVTSVRTGIGLRFADVSQIEDFLPEAHVIFFYEAKSPNLAVTSSFTDGGPSFVTNVPSPPKNSVNIGLSAAGIISPGVIVRLGYDLELKRNYTSHSASAKLLWMFDLFPNCCK